MKLSDIGKYPCVRCGEFKTVLGQARCADCQLDIDRLDEIKKYGHHAHRCPHRINVSTYAKTAYVHGDCMPHFTGVPPTISSDDDTITFTVQNGPYQEVTYIGHLVSSEISSHLGGGSDIKLTLAGVEREVRNVHADPHFVDVVKHGKFCLCGCEPCTFKGEDGETLCNCGQCSC